MHSGKEARPDVKVASLQAQPQAEAFEPYAGAAGLDAELEELGRSVQDLTKGDAELRAFCTPLTLKRYLAARKGKVAQAAKMLRKTLEWRRDYRPQDIRYEEVKELAGTGRLEVLDSTDLRGRPILCYRLSRQNVTGLTPEQHLRFMLFNLESASKLADANGVAQMTWLMDMAGYDSSQSVPLSTTAKITSILQNHYPERLGVILIMRANSIFQALYYVVKGFLDPVTRQKLVFLNEADDSKMRAALAAHIAPQHLDAALACRRADAPFDAARYQARMEQLHAMA